jgi:RNA polymerase sigma factor (sigma-70 family)
VMVDRTIGDRLREQIHVSNEQSAFDKLRREPVFVIQWSQKLVTYFSNHDIRLIGDLTRRLEKEFLFDPLITGEGLIEVYTKLSAVLRSPEVLDTPFSLDSYDVSLDSNLLKILVDYLLTELPERKKTIITSRFGLWNGAERSLKDIGEELGLTRERVRQIERSARDDLNTLPKRAMVVRSSIKLCKEVVVPYLLDRWGIAGEAELLGKILELKGSSTINEICNNFISNVFFEGKPFFIVVLTDCEDGVFALNKKIGVAYDEIVYWSSHYLRDQGLPQSLESIISYLQEKEPFLNTVERGFFRRCLTLSMSIQENSDGNFIYC